jgi:Zn finger protein HypA/HybF involved in hydrogenase expression
MHELSIIQAVCKEVEAIADEHKAKNVLRVVLEVSDLSHMKSEHLKETFIIFREASPVLKNAEIEFRQNANPTLDEIILRNIEMEIGDD